MLMHTHTHQCSIHWSFTLKRSNSWASWLRCSQCKKRTGGGGGILDPSRVLNSYAFAKFVVRGSGVWVWNCDRFLHCANPVRSLLLHARLPASKWAFSSGRSWALWVHRRALRPASWAKPLQNTLLRSTVVITPCRNYSPCTFKRSVVSRMGFITAGKKLAR